MKNKFYTISKILSHLIGLAIYTVQHENAIIENSVLKQIYPKSSISLTASTLSKKLKPINKLKADHDCV